MPYAKSVDRYQYITGTGTGFVLHTSFHTNTTPIANKMYTLILMSHYIAEEQNLPANLQ